MKKVIFCILFCCTLLRSYAQVSESFTSGAYIVNLGLTPQTNGNALKPYGLIYDLIKNYYVPVRWVIGDGKTKDGIDFNYGGNSYRGGTFIIPKEFRTAAVNGRISYWQTQGVAGVTTISAFAVPVAMVLNTVPRWTFVAPNGSGSFGRTYLSNAGIGLTEFPDSYNWKRPSELTNCDDLFVMPHDNPTWSTHGALYNWNRTNKGAILGSCHTGSELENMVNPANPLQRTNFLTAAGALSFQKHQKGSPPYIHPLFTDPVAQYIGPTDAAHQSGSEQIYVPKTTWWPSTKLVAYDPTQANVPSVQPNLLNAAAAIVYGRAWGDSTTNCGYVMYEAGHYYNDKSAAGVAAQRVFMNFSFFQQLEKVPRIVSGAISGVASGAWLVSGQTVSLNAAAVAGLPNATVASYQWRVSINGGAFTTTGFSAPTAATTNYTLPVMVTATPVLFSVTITDNCGRTSSYATAITVTPAPAPPVAKNDTMNISSDCGRGLPATTNVLLNDTDPQGVPLTLTGLGTSNPVNAGTWSFTPGGQVTFVPNPEFGGPATIPYTITNAQGRTATGIIVAGVGTPNAKGCYPNQVWGVANSALLTAAELTSSTGVTVGTTLDDLEEDGTAGSYLDMGTNVNNQITFTLPVTLNIKDTVRIYWAKKTVNATPARITVQQGSGGSFSGAITYSTVNTSLASPTGTAVPITANGVTQIKINTGTLPSTNSGDNPYIDAIEFEVWSCVSKAPDANSDNFMVAEDDPITLDVLANDNDPQNLPLLLPRIISGPSKGKLSINPDNTITYVSNRDVNGMDAFTYKVCNTQGYCSEATVNITIQPDGCSANFYRPIGTSAEVTASFIAAKDSWINAGSPTKKNGGASTMEVGRQAVRRGMVQFDLSSIPTNAIVTNAVLRLYRVGGDGITQLVNLHKLTQDWTEADVTWNNAKASQVWTVTGGTFDPSVRSSLNVIPKNMGFYWSLGSLAQEWINTPATNFGLLIKMDNETVDKRQVFASKENGTGSKRDSLIIAYKLPMPCQAIPNRAPLANPDTTTTNSVTPVVITVLANDADPDGNTITLLSVGATTNGTAVKVGNTILFTPTYGFNGVASVVYTVTDNSGLTDQSIAYITVTNAAPIALADTVSVLSGATVTASVMNNDSDPEGGSLAAPVITLSPKNGVATVVGYTISYSANESFSGKDTLIYQVCEAPGDCPKPLLCDTALVIITVNNRPPVAVSDVAVTPKCEAVFIPVLQNDSDPEGGSLQLAVTTQPANGTATVVNGTQLLYTPNSEFTGTDVIGYTITDNGVPPLSASATVTVTVSTSVLNQAPVAGNDEEKGFFGEPVYIDILSNDFDPDNNLLVVSFPAGILQPKHGTVSFDPDFGVLKYVPAPGFAGKDTFEYRLCDSLLTNGCPSLSSLCTVARVVVTILVENTTNAINDQNNTWINTPVSGGVLTNDFDLENDPQTFGTFLNAAAIGSISSGSAVSGTTFSGAAVANAGTLVFSGNGSYTYNPATGFTGLVTVPYTVCDFSLMAPPVCDTAYLVITVDALPNQASVLLTDNDEQVLYAGQSASGQVLHNDVDPQALALSVTGYRYPAGGVVPSQAGVPGIAVTTGGRSLSGIFIPAAGKLTLNADGTYLFVPDAGFTGSVDIAYTVCNNASPAACKSQTLRLTVLPDQLTGNRRPFAGDDFAYTTLNQPVTGNFLNNDTEPDGNNLSFGGVILQAGGPHTAIGGVVATVSGGQVQFYADGTFRYTPPAGYTGPDRVVYTLCDITIVAPEPLCASATINFLVAPGYHIAGRVWNDANGNLLREAPENGTDGGGLYVHLLDDAGKIVAVSSVNNDGTYSFSNVMPGREYSLLLTKNNGTLAGSAPAKALSHNWVYLGENLNGLINTVTPGTIQVPARYTDVVNFDFAIEQLPNSDIKSYALASKPGMGQTITLNGTDGSPGKLTGSDPEDGLLEDGNKVVITTAPVNGELYYDGVLVTTGFVIAGYDPALLQFKFTGGGYSSAVFYYAFVDAANQQDPTPASYTLTWGGILSVQGISLTAVPRQQQVALQWEVTGEAGVKEYVVERSQNSISFTAVGSVAPYNNGQSRNLYAFTDDLQSLRTGTVYYRIRQQGADGRAVYSNVIPVQLPKSSQVTLWPTLFTDQLTVGCATEQAGSFKLAMIDNNGRLVQEKTIAVKTGVTRIEINNLSSLAAGTYHVTVTDLLRKVNHQFRVIKVKP